MWFDTVSDTGEVVSLNIVDDCSICGKEFNLLTASAEWRLEVERSPGSRKFKCFCSQECHDAAKAALLLKCYGEPDEYNYRAGDDDEQT